MTNQAGVIRPGIFVDTNALHYIRVYLDLAKTHQIVPYGPMTQWSNINDRLEAIGLLESQCDNLKKGFATMVFLQQQAHDDHHIFVSQISMAEIVHGLVEGKAHIKMAEAGVPCRMRQCTSDLNRLVRSWMSATDYEQVRQGTITLLPELERLLGTSIWRTGQGHTIRDVLYLLEVILGHVYFDVIDGWLYAEALIQQVQQILTFDEYFQETVNRIHNPGGTQSIQERELWRQVRASLQEGLASILLVSPKKQKKITIPEAITWKQVKEKVF